MMKTYVYHQLCVYLQWKSMALIFMPFILNGVIEESSVAGLTHEKKQDILFLGVTLCQICQLLCVRILSIHSLNIAHELIVLYCKVFETVFPGDSTPNMVLVFGLNPVSPTLYLNINVIFFCFSRQHFCTHFKEDCLKYGPVYSFWLFNFGNNLCH